MRQISSRSASSWATRTLSALAGSITCSKRVSHSASEPSSSTTSPRRRPRGSRRLWRPRRHGSRGCPSSRSRPARCLGRSARPPRPPRRWSRRGHERAHGLRLGNHAQPDLRGDPERALGAHEAPSRSGRGGRARGRRGSPRSRRQHQLEAGHVVRGEAVLEAVRAAEFSATLPPIVQTIWLDGSGGKKCVGAPPARRRCSSRRATHAPLGCPPRGSAAGARAIRMPSSTGSAPPDSPEPAPRAPRAPPPRGTRAPRRPPRRPCREHDRRWGHGVLEQPVGLVRGELPLVCDDVLGADDAPQPLDQGAVGRLTTIQSSTAVDCR